jgi:mRNA-degrading endonuclease RelE of RelBE toxin-antitoxin system
MDLKTLKPKSDTITVELKHPSTGEPLINSDDTPMTITVWASHSKEYKAVIHAAANKRLKRASKSKNKQVEMTIEEIEQQGIELAVQIIKEWNITYDDQMPELNTEFATKVYSELFWVREQVDEAVESVDVFTQK